MPVSVLSAMAHMIELRFGETVLATATAFVGGFGDKNVLLTNRHNVTGRHNDTGVCLSPTGGVPDNMIVWHHGQIVGGTWAQGIWVERKYDLIIDGVPQWIEHPTWGAAADIVAVRLRPNEGLFIPVVELADPERELIVSPGDTLSVIGFPFGKTGGGRYGIWATGSLASEPEIDIDDLPMFYIDCRTRSGQSGSPVFAHRSGGWIRLASGNIESVHSDKWWFWGMYGGRIHPDSDIGRVWKRKALRELVAAT